MYCNVLFSKIMLRGNSAAFTYCDVCTLWRSCRLCGATVLHKNACNLILIAISIITVYVFVISGFCRGVDQIFALLGYYTALLGSWLRMLQHNTEILMFLCG
jgi:hypothetical protein